MTKKLIFDDPEACHQATAMAKFHPAEGPNDRPYVSIGGVLVFTYLDPKTGALVVSVDFDTADPSLVRDDRHATIPVQVNVGPGAVYDDSQKAREDGVVFDPTGTLNCYGRPGQ